ncbi:hypothetical protein K1Y23_05235 [Mammaliicoccus sciuri]|uniref:hypothetical protein n=1 Tax=Mammaliicoccus sciuri TaxID=1296 RepID=UPI001E50E013|nr:hypothetical protein [Mammaliicoccus sciuri]MCD8798669.1 hypothetical protein [Mammaliicoccus sciuri]
MPTIKTKKEMKLGELIEWLLKSGHRNYIANSDMGNTVRLSRCGAIQFSNGTFFPEETFTVEIEEEITEDTVIKGLVEIFKPYQDLRLSRFYKETSINNQKDDGSKSFYILNDDLTMTLIWTKEKGMVE